MRKVIYYCLLISFLFLTSNFQSDAQTAKWRRLITKDTYDSWVNPKNPNTIFVGGGGRIVFRSYNGGETWDTLGIGGFVGGAAHFNNIMGHPIDTNIVIVGGLQFGNVRRTTDGGETWSIVLEYPVDHVTLNGKAMLNDPQNPDIFYIGEYRTSTIFRSTDKGATWDSLSVVGKTVTITDSLGTRDTLINVPIGCIGMRHDSTNILFMGGVTSEVFISTDGGYNWKLTDVLVVPDSAKGDSEITQFVFSENDPKVGYAVITYLFFKNTPNGGLHKTTDGGYTWFQAAFPDTSFWAVSTRKYGDKDEIFVGGYTEEYYAPEHRRVPGVGVVRRSQDGGDSWWSYDEYVPWYYQQPEGRADYNSLFILDSLKMYLAGDMGNLVHSFNGALNWHNRSPSSIDFNSVFFTNDSVGFAVGNSDSIFRSVNRGFIWVRTLTNQKQNLNQVYFTDQRTGYVIGNSGVCLKTTNGGASWLKQNTNTTSSLLSIYFTQPNVCYAVGSEGVILISEDAARNWRELNSQFSDSLHKVFFTNENTGYCVGEGGIIIKTTDGGESWRSLQSPTDKKLKSIYFKDESNGYIGGAEGIWKTTDAGLTWTKEKMLVRRYINGISYSKEKDDMFAYGEFRTLFRYDKENKHWDPIQNGFGARAVVWSLRYYGPPGEEKLYMATEAGFFVLDYPSDVQYAVASPKNSEMKLWLTSDRVMFVQYKKRLPEQKLSLQLRVYDLLGKTVLDKQMKMNSFDTVNDSFDLGHLSAGVYVCQLLEGNYSATQVFIIK